MSKSLDRLAQRAVAIQAQVEGDYEYWWQGGGDMAALRAYRAHHPAARIYNVTYRGRTVWMTLKQFAIWREALKYYKREKRTTLDAIAKITGASKSTVQRFLVRLDLWRFIDYVSLIGRGGGTYIHTRRDVYSEADANASGARITLSARRRARDMMAAIRRKWMAMRIEPQLLKFRVKRMPWTGAGYQQDMNIIPPVLGRTGGTLKSRTRKVGAH